MKKKTRYKGAFGKQRQQQAGTQQTAIFAVPEDLKIDIAKTVRTVDWRQVIPDGGLCFWRNMTGVYVLTELDIPARLQSGGMIFRTGPDEVRDALAFCGPVIGVT
jgi:hypothetical protein